MRRTNTARLTLAALEAREVPAVDFAFSNGVLTVTGDDLDNAVTLSRTTSNTVRVGGVGNVYTAQMVGRTTLAAINPDTGVAVDRVTKIVVNVGGGRDTVTVSLTQPNLLTRSDGEWVPVEINGGDGDDVLAGGGGNDTIRGGRGDDTLTGNSGNDTLLGGLGNDELDGGTNDDRLYGDSDTVPLPVYVDGGLPFLSSNITPTHAVLPPDSRSADTLVGGSGKDVLYGQDGNDDLSGGLHDDTLYGGEGRDIMRGEGGKDQLYGGTGNDDLFGGDGEDRLYGEEGGDYLNGASDGRTSAAGTDDRDRDYLDGGAGRDEIRIYAEVNPYLIFNIGPPSLDDYAWTLIPADMDNVETIDIG